MVSEKNKYIFEAGITNKIMKHLLLVDDEFSLSELTKEYLEAKNFRITLCHDAASAIEVLNRDPAQLCILDVKMPGKDGFVLASEIREVYPDMPYIFLTGQALKDDRIKGLQLGADDYISKPFSMEELYLRVTAILKRYNTNVTATAGRKVFELGSITFKPEVRELITGNEVVKLTAMENKLLTMLCENINKVLNKDMALKQIWGDNDIYKGRSMNVYITKLRNLLKDESRIEILNAHGEGYTLSYRDDMG